MPVMRKGKLAMKWLKEQSREFYDVDIHALIWRWKLQRREMVTMLRSRDGIFRGPASFCCMTHVLVSVIIPVLKKKALHVNSLSHIYVYIYIFITPTWIHTHTYICIMLFSIFIYKEYSTSLIEHIYLSLSWDSVNEESTKHSDCKFLAYAIVGWQLTISTDSISTLSLYIYIYNIYIYIYIYISCAKVFLCLEFLHIPSRIVGNETKGKLNLKMASIFLSKNLGNRK